MSEITEVIVTQYHIEGRVFATKEEAESYLLSCKYGKAIEVLREEVLRSKILNFEFHINSKLFTEQEFNQLRNTQEKIGRFLEGVQNVQKTSK